MIELRKVTYTYPGAHQPALCEVSFTLPGGELVLVCGPSGSGKSTLLRCLNGLVPHFSGGTISGSIEVDGMNPVQSGPQVMSQHVGFVFQDPEAQFVVDRVEDEIAFALENMALPAAEMQARIAAVLNLLELEPLRSRRIETLSGGEKQRVAIAATLALRPHILALDEPTSQLDPISAEEVLTALVRLNQELGLTILVVEHRLERVLPHIHRIIYLDNIQPGAICDSPRQVMKQIDLNPPVVALGKASGWEPLPLTVEEARKFVRHSLKPDGFISKTNIHERQAFIQAQGLEVSYGPLLALHDLSLEICSGEIAVLMGPNGAGKTTLLRCLVGLTRPQSGKVIVAGEDIASKEVAEVCRLIGYLPQDPNALLFADTVEQELEITLRNQARSKKPGTGAEVEISPSLSLHPLTLLSRLGLEDKAQAYPRDLSAGERQRVALGAVTITQPGALLLDEPTRGLDYAAKGTLIELLRGWRDEGMAILMVTHDTELAEEAADRVIIMETGTVIAQGAPAEMHGLSPLFAPQIAQLYPPDVRGNVVDDA